MVIILLAVVVSACKKTDDVGLNVVADTDNALNVGFHDEYELTTYSTIVDSLATKNTSYSLLGSMVDPIFGTTTAGFYTQFRLSNYSLDFGDNPVCDSIVLSLDYSSFYGDSLAMQRIMVYEVDEDFYDDTAYYSNSNLSYKQTAIFDDIISFNLTDSILIDGSMVLPHLRLTLDNSFGESIIAMSGSTELSNDEEFLKFMKGLHITAEQAMFGGGHASFSLLSSISALSLYYHNDEDTTSEVFVINENCNRFQNFNHHNYVGADINLVNQLQDIDSTNGQQEFYLQGMAGSRAFIRIEDLDTIVSNGPIAVQFAELEFNVSNIGSQEPPTNIALIGVNDEGDNVFLKDSEGGQISIGGTYDEASGQYRFIITRTFQEIVLGESDIVAFRLLVAAEAIMPNRLIIGGPEVADGTRLKVYYTEAK